MDTMDNLNGTDVGQPQPIYPPSALVCVCARHCLFELSRRVSSRLHLVLVADWRIRVFKVLIRAWLQNSSSPCPYFSPFQRRLCDCTKAHHAYLRLTRRTSDLNRSGFPFFMSFLVSRCRWSVWSRRRHEGRLNSTTAPSLGHLVIFSLTIRLRIRHQEEPSQPLGPAGVEPNHSLQEVIKSGTSCSSCISAAQRAFALAWRPVSIGSYLFPTGAQQAKQICRKTAQKRRILASHGRRFDAPGSCLAGRGRISGLQGRSGTH
jgi:hypothetical protein